MGSLIEGCLYHVVSTAIPSTYAMFQEVINDVIIQDVCSAAQKNEDQDSMAVELLLVGLDAVERVSGLPNDIVGICRCLISKFAAACGDHIASILGMIINYIRTDPLQGCMTARTYCTLRFLVKLIFRGQKRIACRS